MAALRLVIQKIQLKVITLTAASGATYLYRSVNGGRAWPVTTFSDAGLDVRDLAYVSAAAGYLIHFSGGPAIGYGQGLMKTVNAGATWKVVPHPLTDRLTEVAHTEIAGSGPGRAAGGRLAGSW